MKIYMKSSNKQKIREFERKLNLRSKKKIAMVLCTEEHKNFDLNQLDADVVLMRPYNDHCILPEGITYPESFRDGPVIKWLWV